MKSPKNHQKSPLPLHILLMGDGSDLLAPWIRPGAPHTTRDWALARACDHHPGGRRQRWTAFLGRPEIQETGGDLMGKTLAMEIIWSGLAMFQTCSNYLYIKLENVSRSWKRYSKIMIELLWKSFKHWSSCGNPNNLMVVKYCNQYHVTRSWQPPWWWWMEVIWSWLLMIDDIYIHM